MAESIFDHDEVRARVEDEITKTKEERMALTRDFRETAEDRVEPDPRFRTGLLSEAMKTVVRGERDVAEILLRDIINATEVFEAVGKAVDKSPKSLMRMLGQAGNPNAKNLFCVTRCVLLRRT